MKVVLALGAIALAWPISSGSAQSRPRISMPQLCNATSTSPLCKLATAGSQPASIPTEFQGAWALNSSGCRNIRQPDGVIETGGIVVKPTEISGYEMGAKVVRIVSSSPGTITFTGRESSEEGDEGMTTITMRVSGSTLSYKLSGTGPKSYVRCSENSPTKLQTLQTIPSNASTSNSAQINRLILSYGNNDGECRGTSPDTPANVARVNKACYARAQNAWELQKLGMCLGTKNQADYQMKWHRCTSNSNRAEPPKWVNYG